MSTTNFPAAIATPAQTIDEVIEQLTAIVEWSKDNDSRMGYFAALYRKVTIQVKQGIIDGYFADGPRMERLDVIFANRYIYALYQYQTGMAPTESWQRTFAASKRWWPIVLQHLLMGMNAHINLDLGIAAAETMPSGQLSDLQGDFNKINEVLASLVNGVLNELSAIWPIFGLLNRYLGSVEKSIINFSMEKARDAAWSFAEELSPLPADQRESAIAEKDACFAEFSNVILHPGLTGSLITKIIRIGERGTIAQRIELLS